MLRFAHQPHHHVHQSVTQLTVRLYTVSCTILSCLPSCFSKNNVDGENAITLFSSFFFIHFFS